MVHEVIAYDTAVVEVTRMGGLILHTFRLGCLNEKEEEEAPLGIDYGY